MWSSWKRFWTIDDKTSCGARLVLKSAAEGLRLNSKDVREFKFDVHDPKIKERIIRDILSYEPDIILLANHPSSMFLTPSFRDKVKCPILVWMFDDPALMGGELFDNDEIVLVTDPRFEQGARDRGARRVIFLPVAAPDKISAVHQEKLAADVSYVGSISINQQGRANIPPEIRQYMMDIIKLKVDSPAISFDDLLEQNPLKPNSQIQLSGQLRYFLYTEANRLSRSGFLQPLARMNLHLYGNEVWNQEIQGTDLQECFKGSVDPFTEYSNLLYSTKININLRSLQGFVAPTHRDFLVPRLGGFLLSTKINTEPIDWNKYDPENHFHMEDFPWSDQYHTPDQLAEAVARYLKDDSARQQWIDYVEDEIEEHHTYSRRMEQLGKIVDQNNI
jgi:hypothetical protein